MSKRRTYLLSPEQLDRGAQDIVTAAIEEQVPVVLVGGYAMQLYGSTRLTGDLDVAAHQPIRAFSALPGSKGLSFGGYMTQVNEVPVDIIIRDDDFAELYAEATARPNNIDGMPIARPEYLVAMKMVAHRRKDWDDIEFLVQEELVDLPTARQVIRRHLGPYATKEFDAFVTSALWSRDHGSNR